MLRLKKAASLVSLELRSNGFLSRCRGFSSLPEAEMDDELDNQVLVEGRAWSRTAILNRPSVLNALNTSMSARLQKLYTNWENNPDVGFVVMKGNGKKAFCAGGDIVTLYNLIKKGKIEECKEFCRTLYTYIYILGTYLKPNVALMNGITMGGGAGVSIPATFRLATEKTVFAIPETLIGFHPDAGASFYLSHLPGHLGEYVALTGAKLTGEEMAGCGLATHYSNSSRVQSIEDHLRALVTDDPSVIETALEKYNEPINPETGVLLRIGTVDKCFGHDTVEEIIDAVETEAARSNDEWWVLTARRLKEVSPLSLKVSLRSIREGRFQTLDQCLAREYQMSLQAMSKKISGDFVEGVRARLVEKDSAPKWDPPRVEQVSKDMVDQYFAPLSQFEPHLELPTKLREAFI